MNNKRIQGARTWAGWLRGGPVPGVVALAMAACLHGADIPSATPPTISIQPVSQTVAVGSQVVFTVEATGAPAPIFQWQKNGGPLPGATSSRLWLPSASVADVASYTVTATNSAGSITSAPATLGLEVSSRGSVAPPGSGAALYAFSTYVGQPSTGTADGTGNAARFNQPIGAVVDPAGNLYIADVNNSTIRKVTPAGVVTTLAGQPGVRGYVDGTGSAAQFNFPHGLALDAAGNLLVADTFNSAIRKVTPAGVTTTVVSSGNFYLPTSLAVDGSGNIYVVDRGNHVVWKVTTGGGITGFAGLSGTSGSTDGTGSSARFYYPWGIAYDSAGGNIYVTDSGNATVRKISAAAVVTTLAGLAGQRTYADGTGSAARFSDPSGIALDRGGSLLVSDAGGNCLIRKVTSAGLVSTVAGTFQSPGANDGVGAGAQFYAPRGVAADTQSSDAYVTDAVNNNVRKLTVAGAVTTLAGTAGYGTTDGTGSAARFHRPYGVSVDASGNVYVGDTVNYTIRKVTPGGVVTTLAGGAGAFGWADGTGSSARFSWPSGMDTDAAGNIYVADLSSQTIRKITPAGVTTTLAGTAWQQGLVNGTGSAARFFNPSAVAVDSAGNVFVADGDNYAVRKITPAGVVTTFAGGSFGSSDGTGTAAQFNYMRSIAVDSSGNVYVGDFGAIRKISPAAVVTTLAGVVGVSGFQDGTGNGARFGPITGVVVDAAGFIYVSSNNCIRRVSSAGVVTTIAGDGIGMSGAADGLGSARFSNPCGLTLDAAGRLYVADEGNHAIRLGVAATAPVFTTHPSNVSTPAGAAITFSGAATGTPAPNFQWMRRPSGGTFGNVADGGPYSGANTATLTVSGVTTAMNGDQFELFASNGVSPSATSNVATLTVTNAPFITSASNANFVSGMANSFTVVSTGSPAPTFSIVAGSLPGWATLNATTGVLSGTPPNTTGAPFTFTLQAGNGVGSPATQAFTLNVTAPTPPVITLQPTNRATPAVTGNTTFSVDASGVPAPVFQWQRQPGGTTGFTNVTDGGVFSGAATKTLTVTSPSAAMNGDQFRCVATNSLSSTTSNAATLTVLVAPVITSAAGAIFEAGVASSFTVTATGTPTPTFSLSSGSLPAWASLNATTGVISGTPPAATGATYSFTIQATNGFQSAFQNFTLTVNIGPIITVQPGSVSVTAGQPAVLSVTATGSGPLSYQWRRFGTNLPGATNAAYTLTSASQADIDTYDVIVVDSTGATVSSAARIGVAPLVYPTNLEVDPETDVLVEAGTPTISVVTPHTGGAFLAAGNFTRADGKFSRRLVRFLANGAVDPNFSADIAGSTVLAVVAQPDGKILVGGSFYAVNGVARSNLARLNADGTLDASFTATTAGSVNAIAVQPDGKILVGGNFSTVNGASRLFLARLNADSTLDTSFVPAALNTLPFALLVQPDAKIVIGGLLPSLPGASRNGITRLLPDGSLDTAFATGFGFNAAVNTIARDSAGDLIFGGAFTSYNGISVSRIVKLAASDGALLSTFGSGFDGNIAALAVQSNDKIVVGGSFAAFNGTSVNRLLRINPDASRDTSFLAPTITGTINALFLQASDGAVVFGGASTLVVGGITSPLARVSSTGAQDAAVRPVMRSPGSVYKLLPLPNGKMLIAGVFTHVANTAVSNGLARLNADLSPDPSFNAGGAGANSTVSSVIRLADGKLAISGSFTSYNGTAVGRIARLNTDGTLDGAFNSGGAGAGSTADLLVTAPGGKLFLGGVFSAYNGISVPSGLVRLNADGTLDSSFSAGTNALVLSPFNAVTPQLDGKVYVGGDFTTINGVARNRLARLNPDGTVDSSFDPAGGFNSTVTWLQIQADGQLLVGGFFNAYRGTTANGVIKLTPIGDIASGFSSGLGGSALSAYRQEDGRLLVYSSALPSRLTTTGAIDTTLVIQGGSPYSSGRFSALRELDDGRVLVGNTVMVVANQERDGLMLLKPLTAPTISTQPASQTVFAGANVTLSVTAGGSSYNTYQWRRNGVIINGATSSTLTLANVTGANSGTYTVVVTNPLGTITSNPATLTVNPSTIDPIPGPFVGLGGTARMTAVVSAAPPLAYQWSKNGNAIAGATNSSLVLSPVATSDAGTYAVAVSTGTTPLNSNPIILTVLPNPIAYSSRQLVTAAGITGHFAIEGAQPKRVLLRAIGPTLTTLGVAGVLADPRISLLRADGAALAANDNWGTNTANLPAIFAQVGAFSLPVGSLDAAIYATLAPGSYTVRIFGADSTPGIALLELFDADLNPVSRINYVAVRGGVDASSGSMVGGLTISNSAAKRVLVRAVGTSLLGAAGHPDPQLQILDGSTVFAQNNNWGNSSVLSAAAVQGGGFALPAGSTDAAVLIDQRVGTGAYTATMPPSGASGNVLLEFYDLPGTGNSAVAPLIVVPPTGQSAAAAGAVSLQAVAVGSGTLNYQWRKDGIALTGATASTLAIAAAQAGDTGLYDVVVTSSLGGAKSPAVPVTVGITALHTLNGPGYLPGGTVTIMNTLGYTGAADALGWEVTLPAGWSFVSDSGNAGDVKPAAGAVGRLAWAWTTPTPGPITFAYTVRAPADAVGSQAFSAEGIVRVGGTATRPAAQPGTLNVNPMPNHSADTDLDFRISLVELTRVIELYNTRNGATRTGAYAVDPAGEDGFAPDPSRPAGTTASLPRYHSADTRTNATGTPPDGRIDLYELTRVIELYNYRSGTTRTGQYHVQSGTEDGYAAGP